MLLGLFSQLIQLKDRTLKQKVLFTAKIAILSLQK